MAEGKYLIHWITRSRTVISEIFDSPADAVRLCVAVGWSDNPKGPWRPMNSCPVPDDSKATAWSLMSKKYEHMDLKDIPY